MKRRVDITGQRFGSWTALEKLRGDKNSRWLCLCDCGRQKLVRLAMLKNGESKSCGHARSAGPGSGLRKRKSGTWAARMPEYSSWHSMRQRCARPARPDFKYYGGRGIKVCDRWSTFANFIADMGRRPSAQHSIDRIDVNGDYEPSNCRWATAQEQANNKRHTS